MSVELNGVAHIQLTVIDGACISFWEKLCHFLEMKTLIKGDDRAVRRSQDSQGDDRRKKRHRDRQGHRSGLASPVSGARRRTAAVETDGLDPRLDPPLGHNLREQSGQVPSAQEVPTEIGSRCHRRSVAVKSFPS